MSKKEWKTDEDRKIYQLLVHKNLIGWVIEKLYEQGIPSQRTRNDDEKGDILIINQEDIPKVKETICNLHKQFMDKSLKILKIKEADTKSIGDLPHIEVKSSYLYGAEVDKIIGKKTVIAVVTSEKISKPGKIKLEKAGIAFAENIPKSEFMKI
ncbi:MAG: hypothetical protein AB4426_24580 [Xenococcaceae cyanobacterium]